MRDGFIKVAAITPKIKVADYLPAILLAPMFYNIILWLQAILAM